MLASRNLNRRQFLFASAGAAILAFSPRRRVGAVVDIYSVVNGPLNLRSAPGLSATILAVLPTGTKMEIIDVGGTKDGYDWVEVWVSSIDKTGFVADDFIAKDALPVDPGFPAGANVVTTSALNLRAGAGLKYAVVVVLWQGAPLTITGAPAAADGYTWYPIKTGYGTTGWVAGEFLSAGIVPSPTFAVGDLVETTAALNIRSGAGLTYSVIVTLWEGAPVTIMGAPVAASGYTWYPIKTGYGTEGWVAGEFLTA